MLISGPLPTYLTATALSRSCSASSSSFLSFRMFPWLHCLPDSYSPLQKLFCFIQLIPVLKNVSMVTLLT
ncbi:hypothetical protein DPMN_064925 [Dreissena polymorpha]|uniref:Uncharacterized protein n=1 Tax=Dreissena polymorpha TaxID=45954 RepID=A0A9D4CD45_DREPO|nr:hypothetical protein DPMN_064925 [Dreissena polymorpha]